MSGILINTAEAAATLTVGVDAFRNDRKRTSSRARVVEGIVIVGGNAINEAAIDLFAGDYFFGTFRNTHSGVVAPVMPDDGQSIRATMVAPGDALSALVRTAPTVSPLYIQVIGREL
jgi:hypothetical protein